MLYKIYNKCFYSLQILHFCWLCKATNKILLYISINKFQNYFLKSGWNP